MPIDSRLGGLVISDKNILVFPIIKMTWRLYPLLAPLFEALGIAHLVRPSNSRPHADMTTQYPLPYDKIYLWNIPQANTHNRDMRIIIPMSIYRCNVSWQDLEKFPRLLKSQRTKRMINAFSIYGILKAISHHNGRSFPKCVEIVWNYLFTLSAWRCWQK